MVLAIYPWIFLYIPIFKPWLKYGCRTPILLKNIVLPSNMSICAKFKPSTTAGRGCN